MTVPFRLFLRVQNILESYEFDIVYFVSLLEVLKVMLKKV